jgi:hypothetical protein
MYHNACEEFFNDKNNFDLRRVEEMESWCLQNALVRNKSVR